MPPAKPSRPKKRPPRPAPRQGKGKRLLTRLLVVALVAGLAVVGLGYAFYSFRAGLVDLSVVQKMPQASLLYDYQGRAFGRFFAENRIALPSDQPVPKLLAEAVVATEDRRFYSHGAVDWFGVLRALLSNLTGHRIREGGSTITQQLARNSIGRLERTYDRKLLEIFLAHRIEQAYTKEQILRHYLDRIYFGQGLYGAETTAYAFFNCPAAQLNASQCALLAGMISAPNASSPWKDIKAAKAARDRALDRMVRAKYITQAEADRARQAPLGLRPRPDFGGGFATSEVRRQLEAVLDPALLAQGGLRVFTTIDSQLQAVAEQELATRIGEIEAASGEHHHGGDPNTGLADDDMLQGAFFALDPSRGSIRAVVGSRDFGSSQYNRATQARRQIGSTIKPLLYATAFAERGYCPASTIDATHFDLTKGPNSPATGSRTLLRVNDALVHSDNYAAMRMGALVGPQLLNDYARRCGVTTDIPPYFSSYLGSCGLSLAELTGVYAVLANGGVWARQHILVQVQDANGRVLYQNPPEGRRVFSPEVARQVVGMMQNVLDFGTGAPVRQEYGFTAPAAGKTGTTNDYKDAWFEGATAQLVAGVWIGYDKPRPVMPGGYAAKVALPVWARVMKRMQPLYPMDDFPVPPTLQTLRVGADLFGNGGQRYYLTAAQRGLLDRGPDGGDTGGPGNSFLDKFLNIFR